MAAGMRSAPGCGPSHRQRCGSAVGHPGAPCPNGAGPWSVHTLQLSPGAAPACRPRRTEGEEGVHHITRSLRWPLTPCADTMCSPHLRTCGALQRLTTVFPARANHLRAGTPEASWVPCTGGAVFLAAPLPACSLEPGIAFGALGRAQRLWHPPMACTRPPPGRHGPTLRARSSTCSQIAIVCAGCT